MNQLKMPFPWKLHHMLEEADKPTGGFNNVVSWLPDGKAFKIYDQEAFLEVMRTYFNQSKIKSFTRQLYIYGFLKIPDGPNEGAFYHPEFVRDDKQSCFSLRRNQAGDRRRVKPTPRRGSASSYNSASSCDSYDSGATPNTSATSPSPTTVTCNMTQLKAQRRNSLSDYVCGKPSTPTSVGPLMPPPAMNYPRRSSMSALPRAPSLAGSGTEFSFQALKPPHIPSCQRQSSVTKRRNSLSDFFEQALTLLPAEDAYATLPCLESLARQQSNNLDGFRTTSIGVFAKQDLLPNTTPSSVFGCSSNTMERQYTSGGFSFNNQQQMTAPMPPPPPQPIVTPSTSSTMFDNAPPPPMSEIELPDADNDINFDELFSGDDNDLFASTDFVNTTTTIHLSY